jgi:sulfite exporter TauE/SafE
MSIDNLLGIGFLMGLLGSAHCIGMCGPLVMSLPISKKNTIEKIMSTGLYHIGKLLSYGTLGVIMGLFGKQFFIYNAQQNVSIIIGIIMLTYVAWVFVIKSKKSFAPLRFIQKPVLNGLGKLFRSQFIGSFLLIGFLNGLLPCGMVYLALSSAMATGSALNAGLFMLFFGLGTVPALLMVALGGQYMGHVFRRKLQRLLPFFISTMGVFLILRGMNLGIPFVSPHIEIGTGVISCHN